MKLIKLGIAVYIILRLLYWLSSEETIFWTVQWITTEKVLPIFVLSSLLNVTKGWDKKWVIYGISVCIFMATYSLMNTYKVWPVHIHDFKLVGLFIAYSFIMFVLLSLRK